MTLTLQRNDTMTRAMALNLADWHASSVQHFDVPFEYTDLLWWRKPGGSGIFLAAIVFDGAPSDEQVFAELRRVGELWGTEKFEVYDCFGTRDLSQIGYTHVVTNPWYLRPPAPAPTIHLPEGLVIEKVETPQQLADFERASWEGFAEPEDPVEAFRDWQPYSWHPAGTLDDPGMVYLNARLAGEVVAGVIAHITEDMVGIYGLSTLMRFRRRGYASALIQATVALRPDLPISVFPDPVSVPIYTPLGFVPAGEIGFWQRILLQSH